MISAHVLMERGERPEYLVRRISAREAVDWLVQGRAPDGTHQPLCNPFLDFVGVLSEKGIVGPALPPAYEAAQRGDFGPIGGGDARLGEAIYERLDVLVKLWLDTFREVPTFLLSAGAGIELAQDAVWLLSEYPDLFGGWKQVSIEEFRKWMRERYGVTYGARGEWTHLPAAVRAG